MCVWHLQDDFGVDQEDVYEVVAAWNEHSEDVETYVALQEDTGLDAHGLKEAVRQWREQKADYDVFALLQRFLGLALLLQDLAVSASQSSQMACASG